MPTADHPFSANMNSGRKVDFSGTLKTAESAHTTIAGGDTTEEIDKLRRAATASSSGAALDVWRSLMRLDLSTSSYCLNRYLQMPAGQRDQLPRVPTASATDRWLGARGDMVAIVDSYSVAV
jgi:hypothetical protein